MQSVRETQKLVARGIDTYYDPENTTLNLGLENSELLRLIEESARDRMAKRYASPSNKWHQTFQNIAKKESGDKKIESVRQDLQRASISARRLLWPVKVGDLVTLSADSLVLYMVVALPSEISDSAYTFVNNEGEIVYGAKAMIRMRFPGVMSRHEDFLRSVVALEQKYRDTAPIGVADAAFSRSDESAPVGGVEKNEEMKTKAKDSSSEDMKKENVSKAKNNAEVESNLNSGPTTTNLSAEPNRTSDDDQDVETEFIVAQAASQLLTNTNVNTFVVPEAARNVFLGPLSQISLDAFKEVPHTVRKLEALHRVLQYDDNGDVTGSPTTVYIFDLLEYLLALDHSVSRDPPNTFYKRLREAMNTSLERENKETSVMGKRPVLGHRSQKPVPVSTFLALVIALRTQGRLWKVNQQNPWNPPVSVTVLPLRNSALIESTLALLRNKKDETAFANEFVQVVRGERAPDTQAKQVVQLFRDYVVGTFTNDTIIEAKIVLLIRLIDKHLPRQAHDVPLVHEYSRSRCYEILEAYESVHEKWLANPSAWNKLLQAPGTGVLFKADINEEYYKLIEGVREKVDESEGGTKVPPQRLLDHHDFTQTDPLADIRTAFEGPVYCIDSEHAHEIDDGVSIQRLGDTYRISVHVANPTSYIERESSLSQIAYEKGTTTYLPEGPMMMLPQMVSQGCGLGAGPARSLVVEFDVSGEAMRAILSEKEPKETDEKDGLLKLERRKVLAEALQQVQQLANVRFSTVTDFPKNFTYSKVNEVLNSPTLQQDVQQDVHARNLRDLHSVATFLSQARLYAGNAIDVNLQRSTVLVEYVPKAQPGVVQIALGYQLTLEKQQQGYPVVTIGTNADQDGTSKSQQLVSSLMVMANTAASAYADRHNIAVIHRGQQMAVNASVHQQLQRLTEYKYETGTALSPEECNQVLGLLTGAQYQVLRSVHRALGVGGYATVTSPLRRYVDMVNHWQMESYLLGGNPIPTLQLHTMCEHLQSRELINKQVQATSSKFWEGILLREWGRRQDPCDPGLRLLLLLRSHPQFGDVRATAVQLGNLRAKLEATPALIAKFGAGSLLVGNVVMGRYTIRSLDVIQDHVIFAMRE